MDYDHRRFYIDGRWGIPAGRAELPVIDPATEAPVGVVAVGAAADADAAVAAARRAFPGWAASSRAERLAAFDRLIAAYRARRDDIAAAVTAEMGAPVEFARRAQAGIGLGHLVTMRGILADFAFHEDRGDWQLVREPAGVCALITPWNWPLNQIACKVAPALAAGCTLVLKPSELAPLSATLFAEVVDAAGLPPGVFNLIHGDGAGVGQALAVHPDVDLVSLTGSTRAGVAVAKAAADTVKRVHLELGGKSPNLILDAASLEPGVAWGVRDCFSNTGQSCNAPSRLLVPAALAPAAEAIAARVAGELVTGPPADPRTRLGPVASRAQFDKIQRLIGAGLAEGARLVCGGPGRPAGLDVGFYVRPTVFGGVSNTMTIAREEIFGPVLAIIPYRDEAEAVAIANDTPYGLAAYVWSADPATAGRVAGRLRAGMVQVNGADFPLTAPFGGYKQSGNGREWGAFGLLDFLETKAVVGARVG
jgi:aldehyde dehydrogenase (NAD+)